MEAADISNINFLVAETLHSLNMSRLKKMEVVKIFHLFSNLHYIKAMN